MRLSEKHQAQAEGIRQDLYAGHLEDVAEVLSDIDIEGDHDDLAALKEALEMAEVISETAGAAGSDLRFLIFDVERDQKKAKP